MTNTQSTERAMTPFRAVEIIELDEDATREDQIEAWQYLIDTGMCWQLQGSYGRGARDLINAGLCTAPNVKLAMTPNQVCNMVGGV